jgi:prepilin peptidase CpaA
MTFSPWLLVVAVVAFTLLGAWCDARTKRLPNALTVPAFLAAIVFHVATGALGGGWFGAAAGLGFAAGGFAVGFGTLLVLWLVGGGGGGDVKMMGAVGAWLGAKLTLYVFLLSTALIATSTVALLLTSAARRGFGRTQRRYLGRRDARQKDRDGSARSARRLMPFGVPLALATWTVVALGVWRGWIQ